MKSDSEVLKVPTKKPSYGNLIAAAETFGSGDYEVRVNESATGALGRLSAAFNRMAGNIQDCNRRLEEKFEEQRESHEQIVQAQRTEAVGKLAGSVAHDFNNLLSVIIGETDLALMFGSVKPELRESFAAIRKAGEEAAALSRQLMSLSKRQLVEPTVFDLNDLLLDASTMLRRLIVEDIELVTRTSARTACVSADKLQIEQVILNLVVNARDAMPQGGKIVLEASVVTLSESYTQTRREVSPGDYVLLAVSDSGGGMTEEVRARLFEPLFTTKAPGKGTGLGLATCFEIVKQSGGHMAVHSDVGVGTVFEVYLPQVDDTMLWIEPDKPQQLQGTENILLNEDEDSVRQVAARILQKQGYNVLQAASGGDALRILTASDVEIDLLLTDVVMPLMGGRQLAERAQRARPGLRVLFFSGYTHDMILQQKLTAHDVALLQKPFTAESLSRKVREVLDSPTRSIA